jgi:hypothetical protein
MRVLVWLLEHVLYIAHGTLEKLVPTICKNHIKSSIKSNFFVFSLEFTNNLFFKSLVFLFHFDFSNQYTQLLKKIRVIDQNNFNYLLVVMLYNLQTLLQIIK